METRREQLARLCRTSCFLVDLLERVLQRAIPVSWMCWYDGVWFRAASRHETALRARSAASARWRGAPADAPPLEFGGSQTLRLRCFRWVHAGSRSLGAAPAPSRYGSHPSRDADLCWRLLEEGLLMGCCTASGFKLKPPPGQPHFF